MWWLACGVQAGGARRWRPACSVPDDGGEGVPTAGGGAPPTSRALTHIKENHKFQLNGRKGHREENPANGLALYVYVWHAITRYWGGVRPGADGMEHYESKIITTNGLGLVNPDRVFSFYDELHAYLASTGIDGVKVDVQNILETLSIHPMAEYHAAARAVGGCAIYVSDKPGNHDFNLLKKLVLPDGSILRTKLPEMPCHDDPV
ncbi:Os08g0350200 [Oryza sativa Japonica Group]|uniref:Os08g0350200 protein n=1 Tax=Oryza sativa subsp. japonica TaxID=39947 RepID=A0A0P0XEU5_ORYSJ|nr:Os08g0350200 [Oryza sativa Japonica Group]